MCILGVFFPLANAEIGSAAITDTPGESLCNDKNGKDYTCGCVSEIPQFAVSYKYLINDIVKCADEQRKDTGNRKFHQ